MFGHLITNLMKPFVFASEIIDESAIKNDYV